MNHERTDDMPLYLKWGMTFINRVGFPIMVCIWLGYQQFVAAKETMLALQSVKDTLVKVNDTLEQQNRILRHKEG